MGEGGGEEAGDGVVMVTDGGLAWTTTSWCESKRGIVASWTGVACVKPWIDSADTTAGLSAGVSAEKAEVDERASMAAMCCAARGTPCGARWKSALDIFNFANLNLNIAGMYMR